MNLKHVQRSFIAHILLLTFAFSVGVLRASLAHADETCDFNKPLVVVGSRIIKTRRMVKAKIIGSQNCERTFFSSVYPSFKIGDVVLVKSNSRQSGDDRYTQIKLLINTKTTTFDVALLRLRRHLIERMEGVFNKPYAGVVLGILFGIKDGIDGVTEQEFKKGGIIHILVASGYNVSVLIAFVTNALLFMHKRARLFVIVPFLLGYAAISGFDPPIIRASIMGMAAMLAQVLGRQKHSIIWLLYSAIIMLSIEPSLLRSVSFQLSFFATLGILLFSKRLERLLVLLPSLIRSDLVTTISAQVFTTPIVWMNFGVIHPVSLIINALILWAVPLIMSISLFALIVSFLWVELAKLIALVPMMLIDYVYEVVAALAR